MHIKATTISKFTAALGSPSIHGRIEIQWIPSGPWTNLGAHTYGELEWYMLVSVMVLGARSAGIPFTHDLSFHPEPTHAEGCDAIGPTA